MSAWLCCGNLTTHRAGCYQQVSTTPPKPPAVLAAERAETDASTRALRLRAACGALEALGLSQDANRIVDAPVEWTLMRAQALGDARDEVAEIRRSLLDGHDPARFTACNVALEALGRLWAAS